MVTRDDIVAEARSWIGTPWQHQQHTKGVACDCGGLIRGVIAALGIRDADFSKWEGAQEFLGYARQPDGHSFLRACDKYMTRIHRCDMRAGDVVIFVPDFHPQHAGILGDYRHGGLSLIHSATAAHPPRVIETRLMFARNMKFVAAYSLLGGN